MATSKGKRRRNRRRNRNNQLGVTLTWDRLEIARGHDGLLRGKPEPVIVSAIFHLQSNQTRLGGRWVNRCNCSTASYPTLVTPIDVPRMNAPGFSAREAAFFCLWIAIEDDGGSLVQDIYARLERVNDIFLCPLEHLDPAPLFLTCDGVSELERCQPFPLDLLVEGQHLSSLRARDDFIAAMGVVLPAGGPYTEELRVHFVSTNERNDWTLPVKIRHRASKAPSA